MYIVEKAVGLIKSLLNQWKNFHLLWMLMDFGSGPLWLILLDHCRNKNACFLMLNCTYLPTRGVQVTHTFILTESTFFSCFDVLRWEDLTKQELVAKQKKKTLECCEIIYFFSSLSHSRECRICYTVLLVAVIKCFKTEVRFLALTSNICSPCKRQKNSWCLKKLLLVPKQTENVYAPVEMQGE